MDPPRYIHLDTYDENIMDLPFKGRALLADTLNRLRLTLALPTTSNRQISWCVDRYNR